MTPYGNFIIGIHTGVGPGRQYNYGCLFFDDKGLVDIFGFQVLRDWLDGKPSAEYVPQKSESVYKY